MEEIAVIVALVFGACAGGLIVAYGAAEKTADFHMEAYRRGFGRQGVDSAGHVSFQWSEPCRN